MFTRLVKLRGSAFIVSRSAVVLTLAAAIIGASTVGLAGAITTGLIYACVNNSSGTIKIISATTECSSNEIQLVWNAEGATGPAGPQGAAGPTGDTGPQGPSGLLTLYTKVTDAYVSYGPDLVADVPCDVGDRAVSAGYEKDYEEPGLAILWSRPNNSAGWRFIIRNSVNRVSALLVRLYVVCASD